jgi:hypothetical protein
MTDQEELLSGALQAHIAELDAEVAALRAALECVLQVSRVALLGMAQQQPLAHVQVEIESDLTINEPEVPEFLKKGGA